VGEIEYIETTSTPSHPADAKPIRVRVYTTIGNVEKGRFALEVAARTLTFFSEYFDIPYPLSKMDLIAIPDECERGTGNWGLVMCGGLHDDEILISQTDVANIVILDVLSQYVITVMTIDQFSSSWMNGGLAVYLATMTIAKLYPELDVWSSFVTTTLQRALSIDSLLSSHPIESVIDGNSGVGEVFAPIYASKSACVFRMLSSLMSAETFQEGMELI